jgi:mono/diheme cytochrome c family protein
MMTIKGRSPSLILRAIGLATVVTLAACGLPSSSESQHPGRQVYVELKCGSCHGDNLAGKRTAPPLVDLAGRWQQDTILAHLKDPAQVTRATPHIAYRNEAYPIIMPKFRHIEEARLTQLAGFLLTQLQE